MIQVSNFASPYFTFADSIDVASHSNFIVVSIGSNSFDTSISRSFSSLD